MSDELTTLLDTIDTIDPVMGAEFRTVAALATTIDEDAALVGLGETFLAALFMAISTSSGRVAAEMMEDLHEQWESRRRDDGGGR